MAEEQDIAATKETIADTRTCRICEGPLPLNKNPGRPRVYCKACQPKRNSLNSREARARREFVCETCGFKWKGRRKRFCSRWCGLHPSKKSCGVCGTEFQGGKDQAYCSHKCSNKAMVEVERTCQQCGKQFKRKVRNTTLGVYCSNRCRNKYNCLHKNHMRRIASEDGDHIPILDLWQRDNGVCGICGKKVQWGLHGWNPKSASIDHIIPVSKGGLHVWGNVQLAHRGCNSRKHAKGQGQLRLRLA